MGKNVILPEQTVRDLLEAYASLAAWYYQLWGALRSGSNSSDAPEEAARLVFLKRIAQDYPELAAIAREITAPRMFVPPPPPSAVPPPPPSVPLSRSTGLPAPYAGEQPPDEPSTLVEPAPARQREMRASEPAAAGPEAGAGAVGPGGIAPPPFVAPGTVKYNP